jgi:hypothetical protein
MAVSLTMKACRKARSMHVKITPAFLLIVFGKAGASRFELNGTPPQPTITFCALA